MNKRHLSSKNPPSVLSVDELEKQVAGWLLNGEISQHSPATLANRRLYTRNLLWFLREKGFTKFGVEELREFFGYFNTAHKDPKGRWNNPKENHPVKPSTIAAYYRAIRALCNWLAAEGVIDTSPMNRIPTIVDRSDEVQPFTDAQVNALLDAARKTQQPYRDVAICYLLLDTGIRASELCALRFRDLDMQTKRVSIEGKGGKRRLVPFARTATKALWNYLKQDGGREDNEPLFVSAQGEALTRSGLQLLLRRLGKTAGIRSAARCSPHTFRHTFAVSFLRAGGNQFSLMQMLGHSGIAMTARYVQLAQADVEKQQRQFSPADNLKKGNR